MKLGVITNIHNNFIALHAVVERVINKIDEIKYPDADNIKKYFYGIA